MLRIVCFDMVVLTEIDASIGKYSGKVNDLKEMKRSITNTILLLLYSLPCLFSLCYQMYPKEPGKADGTETTANLNQKLFYHVLGTPQDQDILCAEFPDHPKWSR